MFAALFPLQKKLLVLVVLLAGGIPVLPMPSMAQNSGASLSKQALAECDKGRLAMERATRLAHFQQGQVLGERAVAADEGSADAHFALFCNLGELLRIDGESLTSIFGLRRMMNELDRALEIDPTHIDALSAKGTLLVKLPGILGGDEEKGDALLQQVVSRAPKAVNARLALAKVRCEHGQHYEAMTLASDALAIAQKLHQADFISEARTVLTQLQANAAKARDKPHF